MNESASDHWSTGPGVPGTTGTPTLIAGKRTHTVSQRIVRIRTQHQRCVTKTACLCLVTQTIDNLWCRPDEGDASLLDLPSKYGIFG